MNEKQKVERLLSSMGRPVGHAGLYRDHWPRLARLVDDDGRVAPGSRTVWQEVHLEVMQEKKATDDVTDDAFGTGTEA